MPAHDSKPVVDDTFHLVGRGGIEGNHVSENAIEFKPGDIVIDNSRDLAWLHDQVDSNATLIGFIEGVSE